MRTFIVQNFNHFLCGAVFLARVGDVLTTWMGTPKLRLEANPIAARFGWIYAIATIFTCFFAYYNRPIAVAILGISLCVCASNASKIWMARTMGEEAYYALRVELIRRSGLGSAVFFNCLPAMFYIMLGSAFLFFDRKPLTWGFYLGFGILAFGIAILVFYPKMVYRLYKESQIEGNKPEEIEMILKKGGSKLSE